MSKIILAPMQPQRFEGRNLRTPKRSNQSDDVYLIQLEVTREAWEAMETIPKTHIVEGILWHHDGDEPEPQPKPERGPYSAFWSILFGKRFWLDRSLWVVLNAEEMTADAAKQLLHDALETTSLSLISPDVWEDYCATHELHNLFTMSRNARAAVEATNAKAS